MYRLHIVGKDKKRKDDGSFGRSWCIGTPCGIFLPRCCIFLRPGTLDPCTGPSVVWSGLVEYGKFTLTSFYLIDWWSVGNPTD